MSRSIDVRLHMLSAVALLGAALLALTGCGDDTAGAAGCQVDADCRGARVCVDSQCVDESEVNNDVNNDDPFNNPPNNDTSQCQADTECASTEVCDNGACGERACQGDPDCGAGARFCYAGTCRAAIDCAADGECGFFPGGFCDRGRCTPGCVIDGDCPDPGSQRCDEGVCRTRCGADGGCGRGEICEPNVCRPAECQGAGTEGCPDGERCRIGRCVGFTPCGDNSDCADTEFCRQGICEERTRCVGDPQCRDDEQCLEGFCREIITCSQRADCAQDEDCVGQRCVPFLCRGAVDCDPGQSCEEGGCVDPDPVATAEQVIILTRPQAVAPGGDIAFQAVALDGEGNIMVGPTFAWASDDTDVLEINADTGEAIGGDRAGQANVTATLVGSNPALVSSPVAITNIGAPDPDEDRVVVVDADTGRPLVGAIVTYANLQTTTGADGVASFPPAQGPVDVNVYESLHNYVSLMQVGAGDLLIPMQPLGGGGVRGGFTGEMDFSQVNSRGDINVGLAGASLNEDLTSFDLDGVLGDGFNTRVSVPGIFDTTLPLPGGLVLDGTVFGFSLTIKDTYYAQVDGGLKVAWGIGGKIDANEVIGLVQGGGDAGGLVRQLLPFFENFDHTIRPLEVEALPTIPDADDLDGDGNRRELVPDYDNFPTVNVAPRVVQRLRTSLLLPALPALGNPDETFVVVVGGVINQGIGFVPMGLNATQDENGDGVPEPITLRMAPPHSGLSSGRYAVVALTFDPSDLNADLENGVDLPDNYSTLLWQDSAIPANLAMEADFLGLPEGSWNAPSRAFSREDVAGADLFRVTFVGSQGSWEVWLPADIDGFTLPQPPEGFQDWAAEGSIRIEAFVTEGNLDLNSLAASNGRGLRQISTVSLGFSRSVIE